ncbi:MAG: response regulator, partial [Bacteroidota bacterium]
MIRTLLIDDEPPARQLLREYLGAYPQVEILGEAGSGREAVTSINAEAPDLVFLDVQMP